MYIPVMIVNLTLKEWGIVAITEKEILRDCIEGSTVFGNIEEESPQAACGLYRLADSVSRKFREAGIDNDGFPNY